MSLVVAIRSSAGIVVASDRRSSSASGLKIPDSQKTIALSDDVVFGSAGDAVLARSIQLAAQGEKKCHSLDGMKKTFPPLAVKAHKDHNALLGFGGGNAAARFLVVGRDRRGVHLFKSVTEYSYVLMPVDQEPAAAIGADMYCLQMLNRLYSSSLTLDDAKRLCVLAIVEVAQINEFVNDQIDAFVVSLEGIYRIKDQEIASLRKAALQLDWPSLLRSWPEN